MKNDLFGALKRLGVFKDNGRYTFGGDRIVASEKTELKRKERKRGKFVWQSKNLVISGQRANQGTMIRTQNK